MRRPTFRLVLTALIALGFASSATSASAQDTALPALAELTSVRVDYVSTFNGEPGIVCQDEWSSGGRYHSTCLDLVSAQYPEINVDLVAGRVREYVYYDGIFYSRVGDERTWDAQSDPTYDASITLNQRLFGGYLFPGNAAVTTIGRTSVGSLPATQYQFWSLDPELNEASGGQFVYDVFVSDQGFVLKDQASSRGSFPMGEGELAGIWAYKDFNSPITVTPPPAESVRAAGAGLLRLGPSALSR